MLVLIKGAGDIATGVALRLKRAGFGVVMTDLPVPTAIRRTVSLCRAITAPNGRTAVEGVNGVFVRDADAAHKILACGDIPVLADGRCECLAALRPDVLVDAILAKRNTGTRITDAPIVAALGPGFTAGEDCHAAIETMRGHDLGRVYYSGSPKPNTGVPGLIGGYAAERVMHSPADGVFELIVDIGGAVSAGDTVATVSGVPVKAKISGVLRGILQNGCVVHKGMKCADVDPRNDASACLTVSDKARSIGGAVLEAILHFYNGERI